jgi:hypothetical protein
MWSHHNFLDQSHAQFQMAFLQEDKYFNDGTYVIAPCSSPEKGVLTYMTILCWLKPTSIDVVSLGCTWNQQVYSFTSINIIGDTKPA